MKKTKKFLEATLVIAVIFSLVSMTSIAVFTNNEAENKQITMFFKPIKEPIQIGGPIKAPKKEINIKTNTFPKKPALLSEDILIIDQPDWVVQNPTIANAEDQNKELLMFEFQEELFLSNVGIINSLDGGVTFGEQFYFFDAEEYLQFPDADYVGNIDGADMFKGSAIDTQGVIYIYDIDNVEDLESLTGYNVDWSDNGFYDFQSNDIATDNKLLGPDGSENYYIAAYISSFSGIPGYDDQVQIPHYMVDTGDGGVSCYWFYYTDSANAKVDVDKTSEIVYYAFQYTNGDNSDIILLSSETQYVGTVEDEGGWGDGMGEGRKYQVTGTANTINPAIAAENDNVYLIMQTDQNGNQDIVCYYSLDGGENYEMSIIADSVEDELFPEVYASGDYANVIFLKGNNLFSALTSDGGETWEISERLNDLDGSVVDWKRTSDIYGNKVVWTDNRGDNYAIYIDDLPSSGAAPTNPTVTYNKQNDELTVSSTDPDGDQIRYGVSWNNNQNVDTWTEFIDSGAEAKVDCEGRTGKVGVIAEDSTGLQSGWVSVTPKSKIMIWSLLEKFPMLNNIIRVIFF